MIDDFNPAEIEQMEPEFETCRVCDGSCFIWNGIELHHCPCCHGCGEVPVVKEGED